MANGKKKSKGLTPAKRKEAAKQSLKDRFKVETDARELFQTIENVEKERLALAKVKEELVKWSEERAKLQKKCNTSLKKNSELLETLPYESLTQNTKPGKLNVYEIRKRITNIKRFMASVSEKTTTAQNSSKSLSVAVCDILNRHKVACDQLELLQQRRGGSKDNLKERKEKLEEGIKAMQLIYTNLSKLDQTRQKKYSHSTLEEFMDKRMEDLNEEMCLLKLKIGVANKKIKEVRELVVERQQKVQEFKAEIKRKSSCTVEDSIEYRRVVQRNKELLAQLDQLNRERHQIALATEEKRREIEKEEIRKRQSCEDEKEFEKVIDRFEKQMEEVAERVTADREILADLLKQKTECDKTHTSMFMANEKLDKKVKDEKVVVEILQNQLEEVEVRNKYLIKMISRKSHNMTIEAMRKHTPSMNL